MKKLIALTGAAALLLSVAGGALAHHRRGNVNSAEIYNTTTAISDTGIIAGNSASVEKAHVDGDVEVSGQNEVEKLSTGDADSKAVGVVVANTEVNLDCDSCYSRSSRNRAKVGNTTIAQSVTGVEAGNTATVEKAHIDGEVEVEGNNEVEKLHTGNATANAYGVVVVNTKVSGDWDW